MPRGVVVIVTSAAIAFVAAAVPLSRRESDVYRRFRQQLGQTILLGLELLVAGDIVRTVAASQGVCPRVADRKMGLSEDRSNSSGTIRRALPGRKDQR